MIIQVFKIYQIFAQNSNARIVLVLRSKTIVETDPVLREAESESDCLADRAAAMDDQKVIKRSPHL